MRCSAEAGAQLIADAARSYPVEGCGVLVGRFGDASAAADGDVEVVRAVLGRNLVVGRAADRYELDPGAIVTAEREARAEGLDVVGFWHTHPDHPARPSRFDTERAWEGYVYVICSTAASGVLDVRAWRLAASGGEFAELALDMPRSPVVG